MVRFPRLRPLCRAFLCAAAVVWAAEDGAAAVSELPAREISGAALNEVSALIDSLDYAIRAERDGARREILRGDQRALCAEADDLKRALLARELDPDAALPGSDVRESEARDASSSAAAEEGMAATPVEVAGIAGAALLLIAAAAFLARKILRGSAKRRAAGSAPAPSRLGPRRAARDGWRDSGKNSGEDAIADANVAGNAEGASDAGEVARGGLADDDPAGIGLDDDANRSPNTEELVIQPLTPEPKRPREKRVSVESPALGAPEPVSEPVEEPVVPEQVSSAPEEPVSAPVVEPVPEEPIAPEPEPVSAAKEEPASEPARREPIVLMTPAALTRLEQEDRLKSDILKLAHRGYTESEIARRLKMPPEQVAQVIRLARERGE